jgi:hypothetical protein
MERARGCGLRFVWAVSGQGTTEHGGFLGGDEREGVVERWCIVHDVSLGERMPLCLMTHLSRHLGVVLVAHTSTLPITLCQASLCRFHSRRCSPSLRPADPAVPRAHPC